MMRYFMAIIALLIFTAPNTFASGGGPSFDRLYDHDQKQKPAVKQISQSGIKSGERKICLVNVAQNKVEKKPC